MSRIFSAQNEFEPQHPSPSHLQLKSADNRARRETREWENWVCQKMGKDCPGKYRPTEMTRIYHMNSRYEQMDLFRKTGSCILRNLDDLQ